MNSSLAYHNEGGHTLQPKPTQTQKLFDLEQPNCIDTYNNNIYL